MHRHRRRLPAYLASLAVFACALTALALPSAALASKCGDQVLADWADNGQVDRTYALHCYQDAIDSIPADIRDYANAEEVISRALAAQANNNGGNNGGGTGSGSGGSVGTGGGSASEQPGREPAGPVEPSPGGPEVTPAVDASDASSVPIPLLLLAAMSLLLLGAGGLGYLSRRRNTTADGLLDEPGDPDLPA
jgi:hypothetical protein